MLIQEQIDKLYMHKPCKNCPFRKHNGINCLGKSRAIQISTDLKTEGFVCHETTGVLENNTNGRKQCAGSMIMSIKQNTPNIFVDTYTSMFKEQPKLSQQESVVDNEQEFIKIQA